MAAQNKVIYTDNKKRYKEILFCQNEKKSPSLLFLIALIKNKLSE